MATAVEHLRDSDPNLQVLGAAYIQHECYNDSDAKVEVRVDSWFEGAPQSSTHWKQGYANMTCQ